MTSTTLYGIRCSANVTEDYDPHGYYVEDIDVDEWPVNQTEAVRLLEEEGYGNERPAFVFAARWVATGRPIPLRVREWFLRVYQEDIERALVREVTNYEDPGMEDRDDE